MIKLRQKTFLFTLILLFTSIFSSFAMGKKEEKPALYQDASLSESERAVNLVSQMNLKEKVSQMVTYSDEIKRLEIPDYVWWNEGLHGVARAGIATVFPQAIALSSTWNPSLIGKVSTVISDEGRAKNNEAIRNGNRGMYYGLTYWSPNINLFRDPRWGRGQETYGEDPYLTSEIAIPFIKGLQGDNPKFRKLDATVKHFAVHSGPEALRHTFDAQCSERELREFYLYAFEKSIKKAEPASIMGAYNKFRGEPCCSNDYLFSILRDEWGFKGYMVSDCGAIEDIWFTHKTAKTRGEAAARAVKAGCDFSCGTTYKALKGAKNRGLISEDEIDNSLIRLFKTRIKLGLFAKKGENPYEKIEYSINDSPKHHALNLETAKESMVLLKNSGILPLNKEMIKKIVIIGPSAESIDVLVGNYNGTPSSPITLAMGIEKVAKKQEIETKIIKGAPFAGRKGEKSAPSADNLKIIEESDLVIYCGGLSPRLEGEEGATTGSFDGFYKGDRTTIELPLIQESFIKAIAKTKTPIVMLLTGGSAISTINVEDNLSAILNVWYPGGEGGDAAASILFGETNPSGKLPITFYKQTTDLPDFTDYSLKNRTYQFIEKKPLYPFGHGLSYTEFSYKNLVVKKNNGKISATVKITNSGNRKGKEIIQIYAKAINPPILMPNRRLAGFKKVELAPKESITISIELDNRAFSWFDKSDMSFKKVDSKFKIEAGSSSQDIRLEKEL